MVIYDSRETESRASWRAADKVAEQACLLTDPKDTLAGGPSPRDGLSHALEDSE